jgi:histidinol phosphatase-like PHP family hydrolase
LLFIYTKRKQEQFGADKVAISTGAHSMAELDYLRFSVDQAWCGWLEPQDVLNTLPPE